MKNLKNENVTFDVIKFILSIMVIAIHTELYPMILYPWLRIAVPLFFMISSYFLFLKLKDAKKKEEKLIVKNFVIRNLKLYLFWFIVLLPLTLYIRRYFDDGIIKGILKII